MRINVSNAVLLDSFISTIKNYLELCKPRVVLLMLITVMVGMCMATQGKRMPWEIFFWGNLGIAMAAGAAAAVNHLVDQRIDRIMRRTQNRPLVRGKVPAKHAVIFAMILGVLGIFVLWYFVNMLTAVLTFCSLMAYAVIYTMYLKYNTSQNIVIGGIAGAAPPLLGWVAVTGHVDPAALLLTLIIFVWTPPHFWALAIYRKAEYAKADVPMLPVVFDDRYTKLNVLLYTILLFAITLLPVAIGISGWIYCIGALLLNARFLQMAIQLMKTDDLRLSFAVFKYSILYLLLLFIVLLVDHFLMI